MTVAWITQRVPGVLLLLLLPFGLVAPRNAPVFFSVYYAFVNGVLLLSTIRVVCGVCCVWLCALRQSKSKPTHLSTADRPVQSQDVKHLLLLPNYKEDPDTLADTLSVLASHQSAKSSYTICLGMEDSEAGAAEKARQIMAAFDDQFYGIKFSLHPKNLPGEMRGKSSNICWAAKHCLETMEREELDQTIVTGMDADSCFTADYFETVALEFCANQGGGDRNLQLFFPFVIFDRNASSINPFVRMFDTSWSGAQQSYLIPGYPFAFATSAYSIPAALIKAAGYWDAGPESMAEDQHMTLKLMFATAGHLRIRRIFSPVSQCNIVGSRDTWASGLWAKHVQLKRHTWGGNLEFSHIFYRAWLPTIWQAPEEDATLRRRRKWRPRDCGIEKPKRTFLSTAKQMILYIFAYYHLFEIVVWLQHNIIVNLLALLLVPGIGPGFLGAVSNRYWDAIGGGEVDARLMGTYRVVSYVQLSLIPAVVIIMIFYEGAYWWCSVGRWNLDAKRKIALGGGGEAGMFLQSPMNGHASATANRGAAANREMAAHARSEGVVLLGKRSALVSKPRQWFNYFEWILFPVVALYLVAMMCYAALFQIWTNRLDYVVAGKPQIQKKEDHPPGSPQGEGIQLTPSAEATFVRAN
ncbi:hypothetical protein HDU78_003140 [Chytriomyces hyalinus]|nr:hypothetical protein HDU78_003140 [Chytriomyces hyalinus]